MTLSRTKIIQTTHKLRLILDNQCVYKEIKSLYDAWDDSSKELLLADLAIVHRNYDAIRFIGDEAGVDIFYTPYDNNDRITPFYIAELL